MMINVSIRMGIILVLCIPVALVEIYFMDTRGWFTLSVFIGAVLVSMIMGVLKRRQV